MQTTLVDAPLALLSKLKRRDVIFLFVVVGLLLIANDFIMLFGVGELLAIGMNLSVYFDAALSVYFDAILIATAVTIAAAAVSTWRSVRARIATWIAPARRRRPRAVRTHSTLETKSPQSHDDECAPGWDAVFAV